MVLPWNALGRILLYKFIRTDFAIKKYLKWFYYKMHSEQPYNINSLEIWQVKYIGNGFTMKSIRNDFII